MQNTVFEPTKRAPILAAHALPAPTGMQTFDAYYDQRVKAQETKDRWESEK